MTFIWRRNLSAACLSVAAGIATAASAGDAPAPSISGPAPRPGMRVLDGFPRTRNAVDNRVAVIGAVSRPGTTLLPDEPVSIGRLAQSAGLTATGREPLVRVFRNGRPYYGSLQVGDTAAAGDVIVIGPIPSSSWATGPANRPQFGIAILGLANHPVVVSVSGETPELSRLLRDLRQPESVLHTARTWPASGTPVRGELFLSAGAVVQLDASLVDRAAAESSGLIASASSLEVADSRAPAPLPKVEASPPPLERTASLPALPGIWDRTSPPAAADSTADAAQTSLITSSGGSAGSESPEWSAPLGSAEEFLAPEPPPMSQRRLKSKSLSVATDTALPAEPAADSDDTSMLGQAATVLLLLVGMTGFGVLITWLRREARRRQESPSRTRPTVPEVRNDPPADPLDTFLADLVHDRLEILEEALVLPDRLDLHGKSVGQMRLVIHPAQPLAGPHFAPAPAEAPKPAAVPNTIASGGEHIIHAAESAVPQRRPGRTPENVDGGLLERVLLAMHREERR